MRFLLVSALLATASPVLAQEQPAGITGAYRVEGRNPDGSPYSGTLMLRAQGARYIGDWTIAGQSFRGVGTLDGRVLTLQWDEGGDPAVYVLMPDGELHGTWADGRALDRLEPMD